VGTPLRMRFVAAQLGSRKGRRRSLSMLAEADDLPGSGWRVRDERTWRTGVGGDEAWARRAREMKSVTAWRSFENAHRWIWVQAIPLASPADAHDAMGALPERLLANLRSRVTVTSSREVTAPSIVGATGTWAREGDTTGDMGLGRSLIVAWIATTTVCVLDCSGRQDQWEWPEVVTVATRQTQRVNGGSD